jgi:hypothetical protein
MRWWPPAVRTPCNRPFFIHLRIVSGVTEQSSAACPVVSSFDLLVGIVWFNSAFYGEIQEISGLL